MRLLTILIVALLAAGCSNDERPAVQQAWNDLVDAYNARDGQKVVMRVSQQTIDVYRNAQRLALEADREEFARSPMIDKVIALQLRVRLDLAYVRSLSPEQVLMLAVNEDWDNSVRGDQATIDDIEVDADRATARYLANGKEAPFRMEFVKEGGRWRVNLGSMIDLLNAKLSQIPPGMNLDEMMVRMIAMEAGKPVPPNIWDKPKLK